MRSDQLEEHRGALHPAEVTIVIDDLEYTYAAHVLIDYRKMIGEYRTLLSFGHPKTHFICHVLGHVGQEPTTLGTRNWCRHDVDNNIKACKDFHHQHHRPWPCLMKMGLWPNWSHSPDLQPLSPMTPIASSSAYKDCFLASACWVWNREILACLLAKGPLSSSISACPKGCRDRK